MCANIPTGIRELDKMLDGGVMEGEVVLFLYDIGSGHNFILSKIIQNHFDRGGSIILILTSTSSPQFVNLIQDIVHSERVAIIDCVSPQNIYNTQYYIANCSRAFDIFLNMKKARDERIANTSEGGLPPLVCFYSLSSLFINFEPNEVVQFFNKNVKEAMRCRTIEYYLLSHGITETSVEKRIQALANTVILTRTEFKEHRRRNYIQVLKHASGVPSPEEKQYSITKRDSSRPEIIFSTPILDRASKIY